MSKTAAERLNDLAELLTVKAEEIREKTQKTDISKEGDTIE